LFDVDSENALIYLNDTGNIFFKPKYVLDILLSCQQYDSLENHAFRIIKNSCASYNETMNFLSDFVDEGLLSNYHLNCLKNCFSCSHDQISSISIITCDRKDSLKQCLEGFIINNVDIGCNLSYYVFDDSQFPINSTYNCQSLLALRNLYNVNIFYADREIKQSFLNNLVKKGIPEHVLNFAFIPTVNISTTIGANRNYSLLACNGSMTFNVDDDIFCNIEPLHDKSDISMTSNFDPTSFWFYESRENSLSPASNKYDINIAQQHNMVLGKYLQESFFIALGKESEPTIDSLSYKFIKDFKDNKGKIICSAMGVKGDSGMLSTRYYLYLKGESRERLIKNSTSYETFSLTREIKRGVTKTCIIEGSFAMGGAIGLDNRELLPPFFPVLRHEDGVFMNTLKTIQPYGYIAHIPWVIKHDPPQIRNTTKSDALRAGITFRVSDIVINCIKTFQCPIYMSSPSLRIRYLGEYLKSLAQLNQSDFLEFIYLIQADDMAHSIHYLDDSLNEYRNAPEYWITDVCMHINAMTKSIQKKNIAVPSDLPDHLDDDNKLILLKKLLFSYGELLEWWVDILKTSNELINLGIMPNKKINSMHCPP